MLNLTKDQQMVKQKLEQFIAEPIPEKVKNSHIVVDGFAGTGKTTLIPMLVEKLDRPHILAPTNKAVLVLISKLETYGLKRTEQFDAGTLHSVLYGRPTKEMLWLPTGEKAYNKVVIVDESSMIDKKILKDLFDKYVNSKFIFFGDSFQLEPVGDTTDLFVKTDKLTLTEVVRHDNGILRVANHLRISNKTEITPNDDVLSGYFTQQALKQLAEDLYAGKDSVIITATNESRVLYNDLLRQVLSKTPERIDQDTLISVSNTGEYSNGAIFKLSKPLFLGEWCLTINDKETKLVAYQEGSQRYLLVPQLKQSALTPYEILKNATYGEAVDLFGADNVDFNIKKVRNVTICTYGYALSAHKSQGSQWANVYVDFNYCSPKWNPNRWLYTAITRATDKVIIIKSNYIQ